MASYSLNEAAVEKARALIDARPYVLDSDWGQVQPDTAAQNSVLDTHSWDDYAAWHLGLTDGASDGTKARCAFVYGDLRRVHRSALISCVYRASEWRHKVVELAAHDLSNTSTPPAAEPAAEAAVQMGLCEWSRDGVEALAAAWPGSGG